MALIRQLSEKCRDPSIPPLFGRPFGVVVKGWNKADAVREMDEGGFHHSSFWRNLDRYVLETDVEALRHKLGIAPPGTP